MALREVILTVLTRGKMTGYEITKNFDDVLAYFWRASHQQVYRELARLSDDGCVTHEVVEQPGKPNKKVYGLTKRGRDELTRWIAKETEPPRPQYELLVKLLAAPAVSKATLRGETRRHETAAKAVLKKFRAMREECFAASRKGEHERILYLALRRGLLLGAAHVKWLEEVGEYLESGTLKQ
jgi:DNA-binding PadR family transcriptional regulator